MSLALETVLNAASLSPFLAYNCILEGVSAWFIYAALPRLMSSATIPYKLSTGAARSVTALRCALFGSNICFTWV